MRQVLKQIIISIFIVALWAPLARAATTEVRSQISTVRIIIVNDQDRIIRIYDNTTAEITPTVHRSNEAGPTVPYTPYIAQQDQAYRQELPSLIEKLYAML